MATVTFNAGADVIFDRALSTTALDLRACLITGNATGLINQDLATIAAIDALNAGATNIHTERVALTSEASTPDDTNNRANLDSADITFASSAGVTALAACIYEEGGGTDATRIPIVLTTTGFPQDISSGIVLAVSDILRLNTATS